VHHGAYRRARKRDGWARSEVFGCWFLLTLYRL
jgi:hypothetical protein